MQEIAEHFRVHYSTVSRAVSWLDGGGNAASPRQRFLLMIKCPT